MAPKTHERTLVALPNSSPGPGQPAFNSYSYEPGAERYRPTIARQRGLARTHGGEHGGDLLWAVARERVERVLGETEGAIGDLPHRFVENAVEDLYDALVEELLAAPVLTREDWWAGCEAEDANRRYEMERVP